VARHGGASSARSREERVIEESPADRPRRQPFAAGDGLTRYPPGSPVLLRIDAPWEKPWKVREPGGATAAPFPGTAVLLEGTLYEVVQAEEAGGRFLYGLRPWDEAAPPRQVVPYTVEACEQAARERAERLDRLRRGHAFSWLSPLVGLLPAEDQRRIERDYGISASRATLLSALLFLGPSCLGVIRGLATLMADRAGLAHEVPWDTLLPLSSYLMAESLARLGAAGYAGEPLGSLFVALPVLAVRAIAAALAGRRGRRPRPVWNGSRNPLSEARDEVAPLPEGRLEVLSRLPKPHWGTGTGVRHGDHWYQLVDRGEVEREGRPWHRFVLEEAREADLLRSRVEYHPEEVRELYRQGLLYRKQTWVDTFAPLWGLLDATTQRRLADLYGFDAPRHTAGSALGVGVLAVLDGILACRYLGSRHGGLGDLLMLLASAYLVWESLHRLRRSRSGEPAGSVLGWVLKPFARRLLV
jgi:hypothetical protein